MRKTFAAELYRQMAIDTDIYVILLDLGYGMFDQIREDYPTRCFNVGASEQAGMDIAVGLALSGKKPFVYSITNFVLYRPFETLRTYIDYEKIPVRLVASGRNCDYEHDGISHQSQDASVFLHRLGNIKTYWPDEPHEAVPILRAMIKEDRPSFISLRR